MKELLEDLIRRFNSRVEKDDSMREELQGLEKTIQVVAGDYRFHMTLRECRIGSLAEGEVEYPDLLISSDEETLRGVLERRIPPFKALATGKLRIKASIEDALRLRRLLS